MKVQQTIQEIFNHPGNIPVRTRTGNEIHVARPQFGNKTRCGVWLRFPTLKMYVNKDVTCEKCLEALAND